MEKESKNRYRVVLVIVAITGLLLTLVPSFLNWQGAISYSQVNNIMLAGTFIWFISATLLFVRRDLVGRDPSEE